MADVDGSLVPGLDREAHKEPTAAALLLAITIW
jgi:hypothetical protein